jgi:hypothetical protein
VLWRAAYHHEGPKGETKRSDPARAESFGTDDPWACCTAAPEARSTTAPARSNAGAGAVASIAPAWRTSSESAEWRADLDRVPMRQRRTQPRATRRRKPSTALGKPSVRAAADDRLAQFAGRAHDCLGDEGLAGGERPVPAAKRVRARPAVIAGVVGRRVLVSDHDEVWRTRTSAFDEGGALKGGTRRTRSGRPASATAGE